MGVFLESSIAALVVGRLARPVLPTGVVLGLAVVLFLLSGGNILRTPGFGGELSWESGARSVGVGLTVGLVLGIPFLLASLLASFLSGTVAWKGAHRAISLFFVALIARSGAFERFLGRALEVRGVPVDGTWVIRLGADAFRAAFQICAPLLAGMVLVDLSCAVLRRYSRLWEPVLSAIRLPALLMLVLLFLVPLSEQIEREVTSRLDRVAPSSRSFP